MSDVRDLLRRERAAVLPVTEGEVRAVAAGQRRAVGPHLGVGVGALEAELMSVLDAMTIGGQEYGLVNLNGHMLVSQHLLDQRPSLFVITPL